jgi:hypothetical protein
LLLLSIIVALPGAHALPLLPSDHSHDHPAGCHGHEPALPTPAPPNYQCCAGGHDWAIPAASFSPPLIEAQISRIDDIGFRLSFALQQDSALLVYPSDSPPGAVPLRI